MIKKVIILNLLLCLAQGLLGQVALVRTYGGPYFEEGKEMIQTLDGGYAIIGTTGSDQEHNTDFYLLKLDSDLNCMWSYYYGGADVERGYSIAEDDLGNLVLCGYTNSFGEGGYDVLLVKVNAEGQELWRKTYGGEDWDFGYKIIRHPEGGYLIVGKSYNGDLGNSDGYILQIDGSGDVIGQWYFGSEFEDEFTDIEISTELSLVCVGTSTDVENKKSLWVVRIDFNFDLVWEYHVDLATNSEGRDIKIAGDKIFYGGNYYTETEGYDNPVFGRLDSSGTSEWQIAGAGDSNETMLYTSEYLITAGVTDNFGAGAIDIVAHRRNHDGGWFNGITVGSAYTEGISQLFTDDGGHLFVLGFTDGYEEDGGKNLFLVRFENLEIGGGYETEYLNGACFTLGQGEIVDSSKTYPTELALFLQWIQHQKFDEIGIFDVSGRMILESKNTSGIEFDGSNLSEGVYICKAISIDNKSFWKFKVYKR